MVRESVIQRIFIFFCCTVIIFSNIFLSYSISAYAVEYDDLLWDGVQIACSAAGIYLSGGALTPVMLIPFIERVAGAGFDVHDYVTQNEDGTTTISQDFVLLVLDAYNQYRGEHYFDGTYKEDPADKKFIYDGFSISLISGYGHSFTYRVSSFTNICQLAILKTEGGSIPTNMMIGTYIHLNGKVQTINMLGTNLGYGIEPVIEVERNGFAGSVKTTYPSFSVNDGSHISFQTDCSSIPIFESMAEMEAFLKGEGDASSAINYNNLSGCESSSFSGTYGGGDISVSTEKLNGIEDKLNEINETDKSIDDKLKELLDWLGVNGGTGGGNEGPSGSWYDQILFYLDSILHAVQSLVWIESDSSDKEDDGIFDLDDMLKSIQDNPETGSQEVADAISSSFGDVASGLTKKFPFSIPWDIYGFFTVIAGVSAPQAQIQTMALSYDDKGYMLYSDSPGQSIQAYADTPAVMSNGGESSTDAPYFELPIIVESFGINETIHVDLEGFTSLSTFSRVMFSIIFGVLLIRWSIAFISAFNEVMPGLFSD